MSRYASDIAAILASGGYVSRNHPHSVSASWLAPCYPGAAPSPTHLSGAGPALWDAAMAAGCVCIDHIPAIEERARTLTYVSLPIVMPDSYTGIQARASDPIWDCTGMDYCDVRMYAVLAAVLTGAVVYGAAPHGEPLVTDDMRRKALEWHAAYKVRMDAWRRERTPAPAADPVDAPELDPVSVEARIEELRSSVLDESDPDGLVQIYPRTY